MRMYGEKQHTVTVCAILHCKQLTDII